MSAIRALGLMSGGLDSALAAKLLIDQGIDVVGLHLESPTACRSDVRLVAEDLGIRLVIQPKGEEYIRLLREPRFGYGRNMNPCLDCRAFMFERARAVAEAEGARFVFTGEVVGQRPMSQRRESMQQIDRTTGLRGRVLRPLSARLLDETEPERLGWVDRARLLGINGRGRTEQLALAEQLGLRHYQSPGGGCLLTDAIFSSKLRELFEHAPDDGPSVDDVALLRLGRHFRLPSGAKVVLGRDREENDRLRGLAGPGRWCLEPPHPKGPTALVCGEPTEADREAAMALILRYTRGPNGSEPPSTPGVAASPAAFPGNAGEFRA